MTASLKRHAWTLLLLGAALGCQPERPEPFVKSAKFGVFFGGQIEERREIPFELDETKQTQGFRVEFSEPVASDTSIEWRLDEPKVERRRRKKSPKNAPAAEGPSTTRPLGGSDVARRGETHFDRTTPFDPGDPLGLWNVRVVVKGKVVIDRPFEVFDAEERERLAAHSDGGS